MTQPTRIKRSRFATLTTCLALGVLALVTGCNEVGFLVPAPNPRGVTIPLPPPSFTSEPVQRVDIEGNLANGAMEEGQRVSLFESTSDRGYFTYTTADGSWLVPDVLVDTTDNCVSVWSVDFDGNESVREYFKLYQASGEECVEGCSVADDEGVCVCFELWSTGC